MPEEASWRNGVLNQVLKSKLKLHSSEEGTTWAKSTDKRGWSTSRASFSLGRPGYGSEIGDNGVDVMVGT